MNFICGKQTWIIKESDNGSLFSENSTMYSFGFVILHYQTEEVTIQCISSIMKYCESEKYHIIVVDNASPNCSGKHLMDLYHDFENVTVILNSKNEGFSKGNNVGFLCAKERFKCDFIILLNNDTELVANDFLSNTVDLYAKYKYAVLGPQIMHNGIVTDDNPRREHLFFPRNIRTFILYNQIQYLLSYINVDYFLEYIFRIRTKSIKRNTTKKKMENQKDVGLHGCCLILSPSYIDNFKGLNEDTYMYLEEDIIYHEVINAGLSTLYSPLISIEHKGAYTTNRVNKKASNARRYVYINSIKSARVLLNIWKKKK